MRDRGLARAEVSEVCEQMREACDYAQQTPFSYFVVVMGDLNYSVDEALAFRRPETASAQSSHDHKVQAPVWARALSNVMEVCSDSPAYFCKRANSVSSIDRFFCSASGRAVRQLTVSAGTIDAPELLADK